MPLEPNVMWIWSDREWYPIWPTTLYEQEQLWREHFSLATLDECVERLAQEVSLYVVLNDVSHDFNAEEDVRVENLMREYLDRNLDDYTWEL